MKTSLGLWVLAIVITLASAYWQRVSGPTHPVSGHATVGGARIGFVFERSHAGNTPHRVRIDAPDDVAGRVDWKPLGAAEWTSVPMARIGGSLLADLPAQPPGRKLEYRVTLERGGATAVLPEPGVVRLRFRGDVPVGVLLPHIVAMFFGMLLSTRAGLEAFRREPRIAPLADGTVGLLFIGGIVLGCLVAWYGFGTPWGGVPFGWDVTDNKTLIALLAWVAAAVGVRRAAPGRTWAVGAAIVTLVVFAIPHSV